MGAMHVFLKLLGVFFLAVDQHKTFGLRSEWLNMFLQDHEDESFFVNSMGNRQLESFAVWMKQADIARIKISKKGKGDLTITKKPLFEIIKRYDPLLTDNGTWWIILFNLARPIHGAEIVNWFVTSFLLEKFYADDITRALVKDFPSLSRRTLRNAQNALMGLLNNTPIGSNLGLASKNGEHFIRRSLRAGEIPLSIFAYCIVKASEDLDRRFFSIIELEDGNGFPRRFFSLSRKENEVIIDKIHKAYDKMILEVSHTGGLGSVHMKEIPSLVLARQYYLERKGITPLEALKTNLKEEVNDQLL